MAETQLKRLREDSSSSEHDDSKRQKPYNNDIQNLLEDDIEEPEPSLEPSQDLSAIFTTLQQELTFDFETPPCTAAAAEETHLSHHHHHSAAECGDAGGGDEDVKSVMRHLLEASDDELGIPNGGDDDNDNTNNIVGINSDENYEYNFNYNGLWEFEDETANYYTVLQSELFM
ncbi:hypothetical protein BUALT_Bualt17G0068200 [Buddleja alternifolia]|uniref:Uncharacterized protein n=1 Tax=Buddleja alternifolia TaxID=168488 RepID=A0AAV6W4L3_9LAMI|nr:hypothetical protein BUALT_Bualt17G0068200 [Buddleja alternifolia]